MPSEVDQVDELIEEYEGREANLILILQSMRPEPQDSIFEMIDDNLSVDIERVLLDLSKENNTMIMMMTTVPSIPECLSPKRTRAFAMNRTMSWTRSRD